MSDLLSWLVARFEGQENAPPVESLRALAKGAKTVVERYFSRSKPLRPSAASAALKALAKHLRAAAKSTDYLGEQGITLMHIASGANRDPEHLDSTPHTIYLEKMADWAEKASDIADKFSKSTRDHKGGRSADQRLNNVIRALMIQYQEILAIRPNHTVNPSTGLAESSMAMFVKEALRLHAPGGAHFEGRRVDEIIRAHLDLRDHKVFCPPPSFFK